MNFKNWGLGNGEWGLGPILNIKYFFILYKYIIYILY